MTTAPFGIHLRRGISGCHPLPCPQRRTDREETVYIAIGIDLDDWKGVLGMWVGEDESAKFWASVLNGLKNRGVEDIFIVCTDNLTGFDAAIHAAFLQPETQNCIIH